MNLSNNSDKEHEDPQAAIGIVSEIIAADRRTRANLSQVETSRRADSQSPFVPISATRAPDWTVQIVWMRLKDGEKTVSGP